ncbi:peroxynitrite isomerase THAP4-like [Diorhabda carinulata]|uniref:peroxynitrite isomerase THAP4-like n=1 Tax=Diorhabda carinulata TaxID=1163345 RepID=UPI0025A22484|nr:peroxynitrite isomerase THAP4-like [Diorhabda carinulata]
MQPGKTHELVKPLCWLLGTWKSVNVKLKRKLNLPMSDHCKLLKANAYDTYSEILTFSTFGHPTIKYEATSWHPKNFFPLKFEVGHFMCHPGKKNLTVVAAHNYGMAAVEVGKITQHCIELCTLSMANSEVVDKPVVGYCRSYRINDQGQLVYKLKLRTQDEHSLKEYTRIIYEKD